MMEISYNCREHFYIRMKQAMICVRWNKKREVVFSVGYNDDPIKMV